MARQTNEISLPSHRGFVVQIEMHSDLTEAALSGRVEHMVSGKLERFHSLSELMGFIKRTLEQNQPP